MEGPEIKAVEAVIDNGSFGKRTLRTVTSNWREWAVCPTWAICTSGPPVAEPGALSFAPNSWPPIITAQRTGAIAAQAMPFQRPDVTCG